MRVANSIVLAGLLALSGLFICAQGAELQTERGALEQCGANSQAGMRECLARKSMESTTALKRAETQVIGALSKWDEDAKYIGQAKGKLTAANKAFEQFRDAQCAFASSLGGGAIGNALEMRRLACLIALNSRRTEQLTTSVSALPVK